LPAEPPPADVEGLPAEPDGVLPPLRPAFMPLVAAGVVVPALPVARLPPLGAAGVPAVSPVVAIGGDVSVFELHAPVSRATIAINKLRLDI
jgi:hypothetical protein